MSGNVLNKLKLPLILLVLLLIVPVCMIAGSYNSLVGKSEGVDSQWKQVETQYQRRYDLIPNLVESTKAVLDQEKEIFDNLARARSNYAGAKSTNDKAEASAELDSALSRLLVVVENYPNLKSNETVQQLMDQLEGTENRIAVERKNYNEKVQEYNTSIKRFPTNIMAGMFNFEEKVYFESVSGSEIAPKVDFK